MQSMLFKLLLLRAQAMCSQRGAFEHEVAGQVVEKRMQSPRSDGNAWNPD